ncbi:hypothetical protein CPB85DRAFT_1439349 [Mucidula mucida]|nr:hypothetical protein CPB85DRAFT_1439349 [Mucidula mucida]
MSLSDLAKSQANSNGRYKEKFNNLREVYTRVSAARANHEKDLQSAGVIMQRLQDEIDLLLEALMEVDAQEEAIRRELYNSQANATTYSHPLPAPPTSQQ